MKHIAILVAAAALAGYSGVEAFQPRARAPRMSAAAAPKAAAAGADKKSEEPLLLRAAKGEVCGCVGVRCGGMGIYIHALCCGGRGSDPACYFAPPPRPHIPTTTIDSPTPVPHNTH